MCSIITQLIEGLCNSDIRLQRYTVRFGRMNNSIRINYYSMAYMILRKFSFVVAWSSRHKIHFEKMKRVSWLELRTRCSSATMRRCSFTHEYLHMQALVMLEWLHRRRRCCCCCRVLQQAACLQTMCRQESNDSSILRIKVTDEWAVNKSNDWLIDWFGGGFKSENIRQSARQSPAHVQLLAPR